MCWSGSTFTLLHDFSAFRDANPGAEYIDADDVDEQFTDIKGGLEALLLRDGSNSPSGNIDWNGQLITNLGAPTAAAHAARRQEVNKALGPAMGGLTEYTIASDAVTPAGQAQLTLDTESDASTDDLATITATNYTSDQIIMLRANNADRSVVVKHGTGNINTAWADDITLDAFEKWVMLRYDGTDWHEVLRSPDIATLPMREHIVGLATSNGTDADHDIDITTGSTVATDGTTLLVLSSALIKRLDASWAVGTNQGGLDTGSIGAFAGYYVWLIRRSDTGVVDALFSISSTWSGVTKPSNYDAGQLIGFIRTDSSSNILAYIQTSDFFFYTESTLPADVNDASLTSSTYETGTISAPAHSWAHLGCGFQNTSSTGNFGYIYLAHADIASPGATVPYRVGFDTGADFDRVYHKLVFPVNASSQLKYAAQWTGGSGENILIYCNGFFMTTRGRGS